MFLETFMSKSIKFDDVVVANEYVNVAEIKKIYTTEPFKGVWLVGARPARGEVFLSKSFATEAEARNRLLNLINEVNRS